jgi:hypothetical protein
MKQDLYFLQLSTGNESFAFLVPFYKTGTLWSQKGYSPEKILHLSTSQATYIACKQQIPFSSPSTAKNSVLLPGLEQNTWIPKAFSEMEQQNISGFLLLLFLFYGTGNWNQGLKHAIWALYHWVTFPPPEHSSYEAATLASWI